jgi:hypothetical protein
VPTGLFAPSAVSLLGQALGPRTLLHMYGAVGVTRRKDVPGITALATALVSGTLASRFTSQDCQALADFMIARRHWYPVIQRMRPGSGCWSLLFADASR